MKPSTLLMQASAAALALGFLAGCKQHGDATQIKTHFPGMVSAGGGTSGEVMAANSTNKTNGVYAGGTPGIAGGAGGNTSGAATGGTTQESGHGPTQGVAPATAAGASGLGTSKADSGIEQGEKTPAQSLNPPGQPPEPPVAHRDPSHSAAPGR